MWQLILGVHPDMPPQCSSIEIMGVPFWTYGGLLVDDGSEATQRIDFDRTYIPYISFLSGFSRSNSESLSRQNTGNHHANQFGRSALLCGRMHVAPPKIQAYYAGT